MSACATDAVVRLAAPSMFVTSTSRLKRRPVARSANRTPSCTTMLPSAFVSLTTSPSVSVMGDLAPGEQPSGWSFHTVV